MIAAAGNGPVDEKPPPIGAHESDEECSSFMDFLKNFVAQGKKLAKNSLFIAVVVSNCIGTAGNLRSETKINYVLFIFGKR